MAGDTEKNSCFPNFRDLGGFTDKENKEALYGKFFRSGMPCCLSKREYEFLKHMGISTVVDFRTSEEKEKAGWYREQPSPIRYISLPFYDTRSVERIRRMEQTGRWRWSELYLDVLVSGRQWIRDVFCAFAEEKPGILFHCASGKDRTGIIAALLLELMGAEDLWILADYALSKYMLPNPGGGFYNTLPAAMKEFLMQLRERYGGAENYLLASGISGIALRSVKEKFFGRGIKTWTKY